MRAFNYLLLILMLLTACSRGHNVVYYRLDRSSTSLQPLSPAPNPSRVSLFALSGINLSGAENNPGLAGAARLYIDYIYPSAAEIDYVADKGFKSIRVPFDANRLQPSRGGPLDTNELISLNSVIVYAKSRGLKVILDAHNFGYLKDASGVSRVIGVDALMPSSELADFWSKVAAVYKDQNHIVFGLMNEPTGQSALEWRTVAELSVDAIRTAGATQMILIPGAAKSSGDTWVSSGNAAVWAGFSDANFAYDVHQFLDADGTGTHVSCAAGSGARLIEFTAWAKNQGARAYLGSFGWSTDNQCMSEGAILLDHMRLNTDVWLGYAYWKAGPWTAADIYSVEPTASGDRVQMTVLRDHQ